MLAAASSDCLQHCLIVPCFLSSLVVSLALSSLLIGLAVPPFLSVEDLPSWVLFLHLLNIRQVERSFVFVLLFSPLSPAFFPVSYRSRLFEMPPFMSVASRNFLTNFFVWIFRPAASYQVKKLWTGKNCELHVVENVRREKLFFPKNSRCLTSVYPNNPVPAWPRDFTHRSIESVRKGKVCCSCCRFMFDLTSGSFSNYRITHFSRARFARSNQEKFRHHPKMNRA